MRQLADFALREMALRDALKAYQAGRLTLREFATALSVEVWKAHDLLAAAGVAVAQGPPDATAASLDAVLEELS